MPRGAVLGVALTLCACAGPQSPRSPWDVAGTTVAAVDAGWQVGREELPEAASEARDAVDEALAGAPEILEAWQAVGERPAEWQVWASALLASLGRVIDVLISAGVDVPPWLGSAAVGAKLLLVVIGGMV